MVDRRRLDFSGITPPLQPVRPGDRGSGGTLSPEERDWLSPPRPALQQIALLVGLAVGAVLVGAGVVKVIVLAYRRLQR